MIMEALPVSGRLVSLGNFLNRRRREAVLEVLPGDSVSDYTGELVGTPGGAV